MFCLGSLSLVGQKRSTAPSFSTFIFEWTEPVKSKQKTAIVVIYFWKKIFRPLMGASALVL